MLKQYLFVCHSWVTFLVMFIAVVTIPQLAHAKQPMLDPRLIESSGKKVDKNYRLTFPLDHYSHEEYDIEWWYLTANLQDEKNNQYAAQFTLFRFRDGQPLNQWSDGQRYMAHTSIHSAEEHWFSERFAKGGVGNAGIEKHPFSLFIDDWSWQSAQQPIDDMFPAVLSFDAAPTISNQSKIKVQLSFDRTGEYILQGDMGYSIKTGNESHASFYYSLPFIDVSGTLLIENQEVFVSGKAWFDHEWTSQLLDEQTAGWDWFSIHFDNGDKLMAFVMRLVNGDYYQTGTYIDKDGKTTSLGPKDISLKPNERSKVGSKTFPSSWTIYVPKKSIEITTKPEKIDQFNPSRFEYYEGSIKVFGSHSGIGFMELTGY